MKNARVATFNVSIKGLFTQWLRLTYPMHKLSSKEQSVLSLLLYHNYDIGREIKKKNLVWKLVFDYDTKLKIKEELGIKDYALQNVLTSLRKKGAIQKNQVNPTYIPMITDDVKNFKIIFNINVNDK